MENEMTNEVVVSETAKEIATQTAAPSGGHTRLKNAAIVGGIMTLGALAWELGVKPIGRKVTAGIRKKTGEKRKAKPASENDEDFDFEVDNLDDIE